MNGRQKKRLRALGMNSFEAKEYLEELKKEYKKIEPIRAFCGYMEYHITDEKQRDIIQQARNLYIVGKHAGSKPLHKLEHNIKVRNKQISKYSAALKAMERIEKRQRAIESQDIEEATVENVD